MKSETLKLSLGDLSDETSLCARPAFKFRLFWMKIIEMKIKMKDRTFELLFELLNNKNKLKPPVKAS